MLTAASLKPLLFVALEICDCVYRLLICVFRVYRRYGVGEKKNTASIVLDWVRGEMKWQIVKCVCIPIASVSEKYLPRRILQIASTILRFILKCSKLSVHFKWFECLCMCVCVCNDSKCIKMECLKWIWKCLSSLGPVGSISLAFSLFKLC